MRRTNDHDSALKITLDVLEHAQLIENDRLIDQVEVRRMTAAPPEGYRLVGLMPLDFGGSAFTRMSVTIRPDERADPAEVGFFRANGHT